ncbi:MAG: magnesium transporter [Xanthomonadales bacterium]|nr:magnesium transporter [Xanthomonadales bacterium]MBK7146771.1 magnesium transporter [Xanthomonadales bacterium]
MNAAIPKTPIGSDALFESAASLATNDVPLAFPDETVVQLRARLAQRRYACVSDIPVVARDTRVLVGLLQIEDVVSVADTTRVDAIMDADPPRVAHGIDREHATWKAVQHGESALVVVDDDGRCLGLIPPQRLLHAMLAEHDEDLSRLGGFNKSAEQARHATVEALPQRLWHRLPWLFIGLLGALLAAGIVGRYEHTLASLVLLAAFVPGIVYFADAVGTQTETVVVRGLSLGIPVRQMVAREAVTGVVIGAATAIVAYVLVRLVWHEATLATIVALSLFAACSVATVVALALPVTLHRLHVDPAFAAGPLATVIQDLLSLLIYFAIATAMLAPP